MKGDRRLTARVAGGSNACSSSSSQSAAAAAAAASGMGAVANGDGGRASDGAGGSRRHDVPLRAPRVVVAAATYAALVRVRNGDGGCSDDGTNVRRRPGTSVMTSNHLRSSSVGATTCVLSTVTFTALALEPLRVCEFARN